MINSVEGGREIKKGKKSDVFVIQSWQYVIANFQQRMQFLCCDQIDRQTEDGTEVCWSEGVWGVELTQLFQWFLIGREGLRLGSSYQSSQGPGKISSKGAFR